MAKTNPKRRIRRSVRLRNKRQGGYSLVEVVISSGLSVLALAGSSVLLIGGMSSWIMGEAKVDAENSAENGIRLVVNELRSAMSATLDANGNGVTYQLPAVGADGTYLVPLAWDGVNRRIALQGTNLVKTVGNQSRIIVSGVILTDPLSQGGSQTYKIFTPGVGTITREVTMELVTQRSGVSSALLNARNRESIYIRNVPQISR